MVKITQVKAQEILDSRGNPTVAVTVVVEGGIVATASVPSGASTGIHEALELRDGDKTRFGGKGVLAAIKNVETVIAPAVVGMDVADLQAVDQVMIALDGTENKSRLGANAILGVSLAVARAGAMAVGKPLYRHLADVYGYAVSSAVPTPMFNIINGGAHSDAGLSIQEYMVVPRGLVTFADKFRAGSEIFHALKKQLAEAGDVIAVGDEGGFAPHLKTNTEPLDAIARAVTAAGYIMGSQIVIAIDAAASGFYREVDDTYTFSPEQETISREELMVQYRKWIDTKHVFLIEDGFAEDDWATWQRFTTTLPAGVLSVGDDLLVTNVKRLQRAITEKTCNAVLIKVNQIGTVSETVACVRLAQKNNMTIVFSHRSGETTDDFIADLSVAVGAQFIKSGAPSRGERVCKYNRLMVIEREINEF